MRPVERGPVPTHGDPPVVKTFREYSEARGDLIERLGEYCSYCEMQLDASLAVEHILPKRRFPERETDWENFLLACTNCNSTKADHPIDLADYFWPHLDNTFRAFAYDDHGRVSPSPFLKGSDRARARRMIKLIGLDKTPRGNPRASDRRWRNRLETVELATQVRHDYRASRNRAVAGDFVLRIAREKGYWSIWMTVFQGEPEIRRRLVEEFQGTARACFDNNGRPRQRPGGDI